MTPSDKGVFSTQKKVEVSKIHGNLSQEVVQITVDKLRLILHIHSDSIERKKGWVAPLSLFLMILVVLLTSKFKDVIWPSATWTAIFVIGLGLNFIWLIITSIKSYRSESIDDLVEKIKDSGE